LKQDDEDDAPTYVMEDSNQSLTKEEYDALVSGKDAKNDEPETSKEVAKELPTSKNSTAKDKIAGVGTTAKKRKAAKVIGEEQDTGDKDEDEDKNAKKTNTIAAKKPKKRTKAVKLTFGDE
jgi:hypothetical protein